MIESNDCRKAGANRWKEKKWGRGGDNRTSAGRQHRRQVRRKMRGEGRGD